MQGAILLFLAAVALVLWTTLKQPWLGLTLAADTDSQADILRLLPSQTIGLQLSTLIEMLLLVGRLEPLRSSKADLPALSMEKAPTTIKPESRNCQPLTTTQSTVSFMIMSL